MTNVQRRATSSATGLMLIFLVLAGCVDRVPIVQAPCPCSAGWLCDTSGGGPGVCVRQLDGSASEPSGCNKPGVALTVKDTAQFKQLLPGRWLFCDGDHPPIKSDYAGTDLLTDGTFVMLLRTATGGVKTGQGFELEGTWTIPTGGSETYQVNMAYSAGYFQHWLFAFRDKPLQAMVTHTAGQFRLIKAPSP